jgi:hypothetical protein
MLPIAIIGRLSFPAGSVKAWRKDAMLQETPEALANEVEIDSDGGYATHLHRYP